MKQTSQQYTELNFILHKRIIAEEEPFIAFILTTMHLNELYSCEWQQLHHDVTFQNISYLSVR